MATEFTPWSALLGGVMIGLAAVLLMALRGRILGATGILAGLVIPNGLADWAWRAAMVAGMITGPLVYLLITGDFPAIEVPVSRGMLVLGGLAVGVGVSFAGGCTSGHGVCGLARSSPRSLAATMTFMATAFATVYLTRHVLGG